MTEKEAKRILYCGKVFCSKEEYNEAYNLALDSLDKIDSIETIMNNYSVSDQTKLILIQSILRFKRVDTES